MDPIKSGSSVMPSIRTFASDASQAQDKSDAAKPPEKKKAARKPQTAIPRKKLSVPNKENVADKSGVAEAPAETKPKDAVVEKPPSVPIPKKEKLAAVHRDFSTEIEAVTANGPERGAASGEIVRETLKDRWTLGKALKQEFVKWVAEQNAPEKAPDVAPAANRTPIIKKAGVGSAIAPQDDYARAIETLRKRRDEGTSQTPDTVSGIKTARPRVGDQVIKPLPKKDPVSESPSSEDLIAPKITTHTKNDALSPQLQRQAEAREEAKEKEQRKADIARRKAEADARAREKEAQIREDIAREKKLREERAEKERTRSREVAEKKWERAAKEEAKEEVAFHDRTLEERKEAEAAVLAGATKQTPYRETVGSDDTFISTTNVEAVPEEPEEEPLIPMPQRQPGAETLKQETSVVRTYRNDAIENVRERNLSRLQIATASAKEREERLRRGGPSSLAQDTGRETPILLILILIFAILSAGFAGYLWFVRGDDSITPITVTRVPTFIPGVTQEAVPFSTERNVLMTSMSEKAGETRGVNSIAQLYLAETTAETGEETVVSAGEFMSVFDPRTNGSFARSLKSDMMFGVYTGERPNPYFIFRTEQFDVAFAGMLAWEENMSADLSPLFGVPVRRSFDPTSFSADGTRAAGFVDEVLRNTNVRILYDELGDVRIVYAFIDKETIVITSSVESMIALIEALRS